ncbi:MAG: MtrB/PioB family outer membrane beta-barrel protein [Candidatus Methylomirabilis sp.]|nr:MtrB/PioB family outer membrane beta-barrel protein [Candidatus Methylomirabilis sp.]
MNANKLVRWVGSAFFSLGFLLLALPGILYAEQEIELDGRKFTLFGEGQIGVQLKEFSHGTRTSKFEEYREVHRGFNFDLFQFGLEGKDNPYYLRGSGTNIDRDDQSFDLTFGKYGELMVNFSWDEIPHFFSRGSKSLLTHTGGGNFVFANTTARQFFTDNDPNSPPAAPDTGDVATANLARALINDAPDLNLRLQRRRAKVTSCTVSIPAATSGGTSASASTMRTRRETGR